MDQPDRLEAGSVRRLVGGVGNHQVDVDDGLGRQVRHGGGADVLDGEKVVAERRSDLLLELGMASRQVGAGSSIRMT